MAKLFILTDILENDPYDGSFIVESVTYAINGKIERYTNVNNIGECRRLADVVQLIAEKNGLQVSELEIINLSKQAEISIADLL